MTVRFAPEAVSGLGMEIMGKRAIAARQSFRDGATKPGMREKQPSDMVNGRKVEKKERKRVVENMDDGGMEGMDRTCGG